MTTLELVQQIIAYADNHGPIGAYKTLKMLERILAGTPSYMHSDIIEAALKEDKDA